MDQLTTDVNTAAAPDSTDTLHALVAQVFRIEDITHGDAQRGFIVQYHGRLYEQIDSALAYDQLADALRPRHITPLFRKDGDRQLIVLVEGMPKPRPSNPWVNLVLFILTLASVMFTGVMYSADQTALAGLASGVTLAGLLQVVAQSWPFAVSLLGILTAHEFGHYLAGRYHHVAVTLPYFIPMPLSPLGTMGAFINMKEIPKNRRVLLDIGIAGPLAGFIVGVPVLILGLALSHLGPITPPPAGASLQMEGNSLLYLLAKLAVFGKLLPQPISYGGLAPAAYWLQYFFTGQPFPYGGLDVQIHPVAFAGWAGILVTSLNLIPAGQLDGGHMIYVLFGAKRAQRLLPFILVGLVLLGFVWNGWWLWAVLIFLLGRVYAEPLDQITPLDRPRKLLAVVALILFVLLFTPVPLIYIAGA